jgi:hypothetical protein
MNGQDSQGSFEALRQRVALLERRQRLAFITALLVVLVLVVFSGWTAQAQKQADTLRLRQLTIVDEKGIERVVIGAPVPNPMMGGRPQKRRSPATGVVINDATGDERGGFGILDDGTLTACLDSKAGEGACMFVLPNGARGFMVNDQKARERIVLGMTSAEGSPFGSFKSFDHGGLVLRDSKGAVRFWMRVNPDDSAMFEQHDVSGQWSPKK